MRKGTRPLLAATLAATTGLVGLGAPSQSASAAPDDGVQLGLDHFHDLVVDDARDHLFVTQGTEDDGVLVTDLDGKPVKTIAGQPGAAGMALSPDGTALYVGLRHGDAISVIDTETLSQVARYETGAATCPAEVAATDSHVWFAHGCDRTERSLGSLALDETDPTVETGLVDPFTANRPPLVSVAGDTLALGATLTSPSALTTFDVSSGEPVELANRDDVGRNLADLTVTPDGNRVVTSSASPYHHPVWRASDLAANGVYPSRHYPNAVAVPADGSLVAVGTSSNDEVRTYRPGGTDPVRLWKFEETVVTRGLALTADASRLYAVTSRTANGSPTLHVLEEPDVSPTAITLDAPRQIELDAQVTVDGQLQFPGEDGTGPQDLTVQRRDGEGTTPIEDVTTGEAGQFTFTDTVDDRGETEYTVEFGGDDLHAPASTTRSVVVPGGPWDVDADGDAELLSGAFLEDIGRTTDAGMAIVLRGDPDGLGTAGAQGYSQKSTGVPGTPEAGDEFGFATTSGDFDGDGFADVVATTPGEGIRGIGGTGNVVVTPGSADGADTAASMPISPVHVQRLEAGIRFGQGVAAGDFDGDGHDDLAVGAPGADWVGVFPGSPNGLHRSAGRVWSQETTGVPGRAANAPYIDRFGSAVATGDANGDGYDDLAIGAPWDAEDRGYASGSVTVLYGGEDGLTANGAQRWSRDSNGIKNRPRRFGSGPDGADDFGVQVSLADHDGDGYADLAAGAPGTPRWVDGDRRRDAGSVSVLFGSADGITARDVTVAQDRPGIPGKPGAEDQLGLTLATGDADGDAIAELAVAAVGERTVTVLHGTEGTLGGDGVTRYSQNSPGIPGGNEKEDQFGASLQFAAFDGDGHDDLAIGAPGENSRRGTVNVLYAHDGTGLTTDDAAWISQGTPGVPGAPEKGDWFGSFF